jgi:hypothetical protein
LKALKKIDDNTSGPSPTEDEWKILRGHFILEYSARTDAAFEETLRNIYNWRWTNLNYKDSAKSDSESHSSSDAQAVKKSYPKKDDNTKIDPFSDRKENKDSLDNIAEVIRDSSDDYQHAFFKIMRLLKRLAELRNENKLSVTQEEDYRERLREIYWLFGGYNYNEAACYVETFYCELKNTFPKEEEVVYGSDGRPT